MAAYKRCYRPVRTHNEQTNTTYSYEIKKYPKSSDKQTYCLFDFYFVYVDLLLSLFLMRDILQTLYCKQ